jgi:hypothetical protein
VLGLEICDTRGLTQWTEEELQPLHDARGKISKAELEVLSRGIGSTRTSEAISLKASSLGVSFGKKKSIDAGMEKGAIRIQF